MQQTICIVCIIWINVLMTSSEVKRSRILAENENSKSLGKNPLAFWQLIRDEGKHTGRNDLLFVKKMMWMSERVWPKMKSECCEQAELWWVYAEKPRFRAEWVVVREELLILASCLLRPMSRNSVLEEFRVRRFAVIQERYDTRCYFNVRSKADISQLNLPHGTDN